MKTESEKLDSIENKFLKATRASYYNFIRYLTTLSVTILTVSITFQKNYTFKDARCLPILLLSWLLLMASIASGVWSLYGEPSTTFKAAKLIRKIRKKYSKSEALQLIKNKILRGNKSFLYAKNSLIVCFFASIFFFTMFAIINIIISMLK